ncbi:DEAD-box ATP-dependent RNA helicase 39 [Senna tora]|uniref:DEAD-box ATP-dependent RNA helicase 39 n=1 Tax=Senna tora TaxID=362788 RepID=A0A834WCZ2_9FABA|nr:DEAD-box ATP-dependent RNA helicase 39 [Senna tora]
MRRRSIELLRSNSLYSSLSSPIKLNPPTKLPSPNCASQGFTPIASSFSASTTTSSPNGEDERTSPSPRSQRDSLLLEKFRLRKLKGTGEEKETEKGLKGEDEPTKVVTHFKELGVGEVLVEVLEKIGILVPSEIECVGIPAVLEGKSVLLSSMSGPDRILTYLLPLIQLLRQDAELSRPNSQHPRALVLCATEEKAEQCFNAAKYLIHHAELKSAKDGVSPDNDQSNVSIGLVIGPPSEILQYIEERTVIPADIKYLVLDDVDCMLDSGLGPEILKIIRPLQGHTSKSTTKALQTVLVTSTITEILGEESPIIKHLENNHAGKVSAMMLEMESAEVFHLTQSQAALRKKLIEAMNSLL